MPRAKNAVPLAAFLFIVAGLVLHVRGSHFSALVWTIGLAACGAPVVWETLRRVALGRFAADLVAMLAIVTALLLDQPLAGLIVVLMQTGGEGLERYAEGRASAAVAELEAAAPRVAHLLSGDELREIGVDAVAPGDLLLLRPGELLPCDAVVVEGQSHVDASRLTGEPLPVSAAPGVGLLSGSLNLESPLTVRATARASESQYARIVELVRNAQESKAPIQRLADRYAVWFTPLTLAMCAVAYLMSRDPVRVLAVLVVATPCPLILATPVAIVGGINRAARQGIIFRHGGAIEQLAGVSVAVFDKTGTLTIGRPRVARILPAASLSEADLLRLAAAVEQGSGHLLARTIVQEAFDRGIALPPARQVIEAAGQGVAGEVEGHEVAVGGRSFIAAQLATTERSLAGLAGLDGGSGLRAYVRLDGAAAGVIEYADRVRPGLVPFIALLRRLGLHRILLLSGDDQANAMAVARSVGITEVQGDLLPEDKVSAVEQLTRAGERVLMVGDGTNDAPALSAATVGIALASGGGGISAEAADAVLLADDPTPIAAAIEISRRTLRVARQSIWTGLGLSGTAMVAASAGYLQPVIGALLQEAIDVAVILNALRAAFPPRAKEISSDLHTAFILQR